MSLPWGFRNPSTRTLTIAADTPQKAPGRVLAHFRTCTEAQNEQNWYRCSRTIRVEVLLFFQLLWDVSACCSLKEIVYPALFQTENYMLSVDPFRRLPALYGPICKLSLANRPMLGAHRTQSACCARKAAT